MLDPEKLEACFRAWVNAVVDRLKGQIISIDGKTIRGGKNGRTNKRLFTKYSIIIIDSMGCQDDIAGCIIDGGGDYVLVVKNRNSNTLLHCNQG